MTVPEEALAEDPEFPRASREQWQRLVAGVLAKSGKTGLTGPAAEEALVTDGAVGVAGGRVLTPQRTPRPPPCGPGSRRSCGVAGWPARSSTSGTSGSSTQTPIRAAPTKR